MSHVVRSSLAVVVALGVLALAGPSHAQSYFTISVVESGTSNPIPCATLTLTHNAVYTSDANGIVAFYEPGLMGQSVWFAVAAAGYTFPADGFGFVGKRFTVTEGGSGVIQGTLTGTPPACTAGTDDSTLVTGPVPPPSEHFRIEVIDVETGRGVPIIEVRSPERGYWTDNAGLVAFYDPDLMDQLVTFEVDGHGYDLLEGTSVQLETTRGATAQVFVAREAEQIAERLYRITGAGAYRDSVLLGETPPTAFPNLNGLVMGQDTVHTAMYQGELFWLWGDTKRPSYPLGNFKTSSATSLLPGAGGLDPSVGVDLSYFVDANGFSKEMAPASTVPNPPGVGGFLLAWLGGLVSAPDATGTERLFAYYNLGGFDSKETGIVRFDDAQEVFVKALAYDGSEVARLNGQTMIVGWDGTDRVHFGMAGTVRAERSEAVFLDPTLYETFTPLEQGSSTVVVRDPSGAPVYDWKTGTGVANQAMVDAGLLLPEEVPFAHNRDPDTGAAVADHSGGAAWNPWRGRYGRIMLQGFGATSLIGEVWYQEADTPMGPWVYARQVVTHQGYSFYNPAQHPYFAEDDGRRIYFEATYTSWLSGQTPTPRHNYNQVMYRLDLEDPRLALPLPVYDLAETLPGDFVTRPQLRPWMEDSPAAFFAQDRPVEGSVPVYWTGACADRELEAGGEPETEPLFWALPENVESPPPDAVPLYEYENQATDEHAYSVDATLSLPGFALDDPVAFVWRNPMPAVTLPVTDYLDPIVVDAGADQCTVEDTPGAGTTVLLNGLQTSFAAAGFDQFTWTWEGGSAAGIAAFAELPLGVHSIRLDASAPDGTTGHDYVTIEVAEHVTTTCNDGIDNDGDTLVDFPDDLGCTNGADDSEQNPDLTCDDGIDNDGDGLADYPNDPGCNTNIASREDPECDDGIDNDGDGLIDWDAPGGGSPDPECIDKPWRNSEAGEGCGLGGEVAPLLLGLARLRRRRRAA